MKLNEFSNQHNDEQNIDEAGGFIDRKILSRVGTKLSKTKANTRVTDAQRAEALWEAWISVTGGSGMSDLGELISWLNKEVKVDGIDVNMEIIKQALKNSSFAKHLSPQKLTALVQLPQLPNNELNTPHVEPKKEKKPHAPSKSTALDLPPLSSNDNEWTIWADQLSTKHPQVYIKLAKALGAKVSTPKRNG